MTAPDRTLDDRIRALAEKYADWNAAADIIRAAYAMAIDDARRAVIEDTRLETVQSNWTLRELGADIAERVIGALAAEVRRG